MIDFIPRIVSVLSQIKVKPLFLMEEIGAAPCTAGMIGDEMLVVVALTNALGHGADGISVKIVLRIAVASQYPNDFVLAVSLGYPLSVDAGIGRIEERLVSVVPISSPCGQQGNIQSQFIGPFHDVVHMIPVIIVVARAQCRSGRVSVLKRQVTVGIGCIQTVVLGQCYSLNHGETFLGAVLKIFIGLFTGEPMKELPGRVGQIKEGLVVFVCQITLVF